MLGRYTKGANYLFKVKAKQEYIKITLAAIIRKI